MPRHLGALSLLLAVWPAAIFGQLEQPDQPPKQPPRLDSASLLPVPGAERWGPAMAGEPAWTTWLLQVGPSGGLLSLSFDVVLAGPSDLYSLDIAYDKQAWTPIEVERLGHGRVSVDLSAYAEPGPLAVRLTLVTSRPGRCWFGVPRFAGSGWRPAPLPPEVLGTGCWLAPAWAALRDGRQAEPLPPGAWPNQGVGGQPLALLLKWSPAPGADLWQADSWAPGLARPDGWLHLVAGRGGPGSYLATGQLASGCEAQPEAVIGLSLPRSSWSTGAPLVASSVARSTLLARITGPLELRQVALVPTGMDQLDRLIAIVYNHGAEPLSGQLTAREGAGSGPSAVWCGYRFPPGPSVASLLVSSSPSGAETWLAGVSVGQRWSDSQCASATSTGLAPAADRR